MIFNQNPVRTDEQNVRNRTDFVDQLEQFQTKALKYLIGCPKSTSSSIVRLFSGVEPLSSRFDLLKLRYFWKLSHGDKHNIAYRLYNCRRRNFLLANKGFTYEVFNLCCKYNVINFWHGKIQGFTNPNIYIKKQVLKFNLKVDLENGRNTSCGFSDVYLQNVFKYQEKYHLKKPFNVFNFFTSTRARTLIIKVLLHPRDFMLDCGLCSCATKCIFDHLLYDCKYLADHRLDLRNMLNFYNFPMDCFSSKIKFLATCLEKKAWTRCLTDFLEEANY